MVSTPRHDSLPDPVPAMAAERLPLSAFLQNVWNGEIEGVRAWLEDFPDNLTKTDPRTGMTALHLAVGRGNLEMAKFLVEAGAVFVPDNEGRMPSVIAAEMEVSEELADYIVEAENRALQGQGQEDV